MYRKIAVLPILFVCVCPLFAQNVVEKGHGDNSVNKTQQEDRTYKTILFNFKSIDCPEKETKAIEDKIASGLKRFPLISLNLNKDIVYLLKGYGSDGRCYDEKCAIINGNHFGAKRVIIGSVAKRIKIIKEEAGKEDQFKYIFKERQEEYYVINVKLVDVFEGKVLAENEEKPKKDEIDQSVWRIINKLQEHFKPKTTIKEKPISTPTDDTYYTNYALSLSWSNVFPIGRFNRISNYLGGPSLNLEGMNIGFKNSIFMLNSSYYFVSANKGSIKSYQSVEGQALAGYTFRVYNKITISPLIGAGFYLHLMKDSEEGNKSYLDPLLSIKCEAKYRLSNDMNIVFQPGYNFVFEKGYRGNFINLDLGIQYIF